MLPGQGIRKLSMTHRSYPLVVVRISFAANFHNVSDGREAVLVKENSRYSTAGLKLPGVGGFNPLSPSSCLQTIIFE